MRNQWLLGVIAAVAIPAVAPAQNHDPLPTWSIPQWTISRDPLPNWAVPPLISGPSVKSPPPSIGVPPQHVNARTRFGEPHARTRGNSGRAAYPGWPFVVYMTAAPAPAPAPVLSAPQSPANDEAAKGSLILHVQPGSAQVFVDGYYVGTADDFNGSRRSLILDAGAHSVELDEPAHETVRFDVIADSNEPIVFRRDLARVSAAPPVAPIVSTPIYAIPGCYLGNVPPQDAGLPSTCDLSRAIRLK